MKTITKVLVSVVGLITLALQNDAVQGIIGGLLSAHPKVSAVIGGIAGILALVHVPKAS